MKRKQRLLPAVAYLFLARPMRLHHLIALFGVAALTDSTFAADRCKQISDLVGQAAAIKPKLVEQLKKDRPKGTLGEPWRWFAFTLGRDLDKLRVAQDEQRYIFMTVANLHFSNKPVVDFTIFQQYFYLRCKRKDRGLSTPPLALIPAVSLTRCMDTANSEAQFQQCMEKLLEKP